MSSKERFGTEVWKAAKQLSKKGSAAAPYLMSVGEVAAAAEVSKPTARKYLRELANIGHMERIQAGNSEVFKMLP